MNNYFFPDDLNFNSLLQRIKDGAIEELILATNATMEGQITAQFIADSCKNEKWPDLNSFGHCS